MWPLGNIYSWTFAKESTDKQQKSQGIHYDMWKCVYQSREKPECMQNVIKAMGSKCFRQNEVTLQ